MQQHSEVPMFTLSLMRLFLLRTWNKWLLCLIEIGCAPLMSSIPTEDRLWCNANRRALWFVIAHWVTVRSQFGAVPFLALLTCSIVGVVCRVCHLIYDWNSFLLRYFDMCLLLVTSCSCLLSLCNWQQCVVSFCSLSFSHMLLLLLLLLLLLSTVLVVHAIFIFHLLWVGEWGSRSCGWEGWDAGVDMQIGLCVMSSRLSPVSTCDKCC